MICLPAISAYRNRGFTLLEILVAVSLLSIALLVIARLFSAGSRAIFSSEERVSIAVRADVRMREVLSEDLSVEKAWSEITDDGYRLDVSVNETLTERMAGLPVRLMEITVSIYRPGGSDKKPFTLRTVRMIQRELK
jgi:prepilin-type N-terminal cleavage/methylation domain-containing protein